MEYRKEHDSMGEVKVPSDRLWAAQTQRSHENFKIGVDIEEHQDGFIVSGKTKLKGNAELESYHDHRLAMSYYIAGLICENEIAINGFEWTKISFPEFEELVEELN